MVVVVGRARGSWVGRKTRGSREYSRLSEPPACRAEGVAQRRLDFVCCFCDLGARWVVAGATRWTDIHVQVPQAKKKIIDFFYAILEIKAGDPVDFLSHLRNRGGRRPDLDF